MGSRGIYHDGWFACTFGPRTPWVPGLPPGITEWSPDKDTWELYNLDEDWSQANDLAAKMPEKLAEMKRPVPGRIDEEQEPADRRRPVDAGPPPGGRASHRPTPSGRSAARSPGCRSSPPRSSASSTTSSRIDVDVPENANGVLYALGGFSGGLTCYVKDGVLCYEYNLFEIQRTQIKAKEKLPAGKVKIEVETKLVGAKPAGPAGRHPEGQRQGRGQGQVPMTAPLLVHRERLPRHRQRSRLAGVARLLRPGPVRVQRHDRRGEGEVLVARSSRARAACHEQPSQNI